jgi:hypothetical protein
MENLKDIYTYWENEPIQKVAALKTVYAGAKDLFHGATKAVEKATDLAKDWVAKPMMLSIPTSAVLLAVAYNKLRSPSIVSKNIDKRLLINTLDTEIAVARRQIAELEAKRNKGSEKKYDRFV